MGTPGCAGWAPKPSPRSRRSAAVREAVSGLGGEVAVKLSRTMAPCAGTAGPPRTAFGRQIRPLAPPQHCSAPTGPAAQPRPALESVANRSPGHFAVPYTVAPFAPSPRPCAALCALFGYTALFCVPVAAVLTVAIRRDASGATCCSRSASASRSSWSARLVRFLPGVRDLPLRTAILVSLLVALPVGYVARLHHRVPDPGRAAAPDRPVQLARGRRRRHHLLHRFRLLPRVAEAPSQRRGRRPLDRASGWPSRRSCGMLRAQLEPHMLFNTLANLRSLIDDEPEAAKHMIDLLINYLRGALAGIAHGQRDAPGRVRSAAGVPRDHDGAAGQAAELQAGAGDGPRAGAGAADADAAAGRKCDQARHRTESRRRQHRRERRAGSTACWSSPSSIPGSASRADLPGRRGNGQLRPRHVRDRLRALYGTRASLRLEPRTPTGTRAVVRIP